MSERISYNFSYFYYNRFMINTEYPDIVGIKSYKTIEDYFDNKQLTLVPIDLPDNNINLKFNTEVLYPGLLIGIGNTNLYIMKKESERIQIPLTNECHLRCSFCLNSKKEQLNIYKLSPTLIKKYLV